MAPPVLCRPVSRLLAPARLPSAPRARWKFYVREPPRDGPDWPKVGLTLGTAVALWIHVSWRLRGARAPLVGGGGAGARGVGPPPSRGFAEGLSACDLTAEPRDQQKDGRLQQPRS
ncbi:unnamed protein product [Nyctereutes procyonoides]|uniref:NADH dehydrogenase [ubiquinone] 1 subunit C1, mitochondrial n=1 Tax=Nyctereutes procyonoides TaxID=34880 RepID=A0A811Y2F3_NYCPR|nr:unnamed protein product [Nyctereutes procyonoides]